MTIADRAEQCWWPGQPLAHPDGRGRVTPLTLDVTNQAQLQAAAEKATGGQRWIGGLG
jgi:hypothetical protein